MGVTHEEMLKELKEHISHEFQRHIEDYHDDDATRDFGVGEPVSVRELVREHVTMKSNIEEIAEAFLGKERSPLMGGGRDNSGIIGVVKENSRQLKMLVEAQAQPSKMVLKVPASIWVAIITTIGLLGAAVIGLFA